MTIGDDGIASICMGKAHKGDPCERCGHAETLTIECSHCKGRGEIELTGVHADTLTLLRLQARALNGAALARLAGVQPTAMNNRLNWLESHGLAISERYGSQKRWRANN